MSNVDWWATSQLVAIVALAVAGLVSGIRASLRRRQLERQRRTTYVDAYMRRVDKYQRDCFYDPFD